MSVTELSVKRPATIIVVMIVLVGLGVMGYFKMGADLLPPINIPVITISTTYAGAGAEEIKKDVVKPIENAVSGISGVDKIQSSAKESFGTVMIMFTMETDMNSAFTDVQKAVENVSARLPKNSDKPILLKLDPGEQSVLTLSVNGTKSYEEIYNEADKIKTKVERVPGVGKVSLQGAIKQVLNIKIDKTALEFYGINLNSVINKIRTENSNMPAGQIKEEKSLEAVKVVVEFSDVNEIRNLQIPAKGGGTVRLFEIATIDIEYPDKDQLLKYNGITTIGIGIQKQSDANVVDVVKRVTKEVEAIKTLLPKGIEIVVASDSSVFITNALDEIKRNLAEGVLTTALVLFLFLRSFRSSLIVLVAIPTSLAATCFMMYEVGFTLNIMSLMALSLCIGILVDDSIVVLENIQRHLAMGKSPFAAAIEGRKEIGMAAIAITLCDVVVFAPVAFVSGMTGQFFRQFGLTVVFATLFSLFVSFTITPMLASRFLKKQKHHVDMDMDEEQDVKVENFKTKDNKANAFARIFNKAIDSYKNLLLWALDNRWKVIGFVSLGIVLTLLLIPFGFIGMESMSQSDQSTLFVSMRLNPGSTLEMTDEKVKYVENYLRTIPEVRDFFSTVGSSSDRASATLNVRLKGKNDREKSQSELATIVRKWGKNIPGVDFTVSEAQSGGGGGGGSNPVQVNVLGNETAVINEISKKVEEIVKGIPGIIDVNNSAKSRDSEIRVKIDRLAANEYGLAIADVSSVLRTALQGTNSGVFRENGNEHDIIVRFVKGQIKTADDIGAIKISNSSGNLISLNQVAEIVREDSQQTISRMDRQDVVKITANLQGVKLGDVNTKIQEQIAKLSLPSGYSIQYGSSIQQMQDIFINLAAALGASIVLVYLILVVLYESFLTPLIRMLSLPCSIIGAVGILALTNNTLNMMSMIGFIMLDGLASKNGTLLIDYANTLMKKGLPLKEALIKSGTTRLRPIIMTSVTMVVGMLPVALSLGEGTEFKSSLAVVIIGGMITSTILTPIVIPVVYTLFDDFNTWRIRNRKKTSLLEVEQICE